jgi:hypothetical protein
MAEYGLTGNSAGTQSTLGDYSPYIQQAQQIYGSLGGKYSAANVVALANQLYAQNAPAAPKAVTPTIQTAIASVGAAQNIVKQLATLYFSLNPSKGPMQLVKGRIASIGGKLNLNPNARIYEDARKGLMSRVARALGETGVLNEGDIARSISLIPDLTVDSETAAGKFKFLLDAMAGASERLQSVATMTTSDINNLGATASTNSTETNPYGGFT